ncbi:hypothetical protein LSH36_446g02052 [Paralvinella palmiformis]|uniref:Tight junction protein ZO-1 n=1 Tax=Paralvinella palmiformis TaxID=53620 RepID=A0AAD9MZL6_9ANNE|nr:hypothetical protein LSH36_446g02052 [Paralvinella palmiformis]
MGKKTHGPILVAAIEHSDFEKVREVLITHIKSKQRIQELCTSDVRRLASEYTEVPLLLAATLPDPTIIQFLVCKQEVNINFVQKEVVKRKTKVKTALILAVRAGLVNTVDAILAMNADPNLQDHKLRTALHHAVRKADYRMAKMLLTRGAQPNIVDAAGNTPLHMATIFGHTELVKLLVKHDSDMFKKGTGGAIPIHMAAKEGHNVLVRLFCDYDVNVNTKVPCYDNREKAPIHVAAEEGHAETVATLLEDCGAEPNIRDSMGETPLHCACLREYDPMGMKSKDEYTETVRVLLNSGAHIDLQNSRGETPLHLATRNEFQKTVELLIHAGSDPTIEDNGGYKPYDLATVDDTVTIQLLKSAMEERIRIMNDAMEVRAKGYSTALIKPSVSSRSALSINSVGSNEFILASGGPNGSNAVYEDGYLKPVGLRSRSNTKGSSLTGSSQDIFGKSHSTSSSGGSKSAFSRGKKKSQSLLPQFRVKGAAKNSQRSLDRSADSNPNNFESRARNNSCSSPNSGQNVTRTLPKPPVEMRNAGLSQQRANRGAEVDSFWDVTPRNSACDNEPTQPSNSRADELQQSYESLPGDDIMATASLGGKGRGRRVPRQSPVGKKPAIQIQPAFPNANKIPASPLKNGTADSDDDDDSFYDDESFDTLDTLSEKEAPAVPPKPSKTKLAQSRLKYTPEEKRKIQNAVSNQSLHSWLEEQADIIVKDGPPEPPSAKHENVEGNDEYSTVSEFSSVSRTHQDPNPSRQPFIVGKKDGPPPPLPPKPGTRVASQQQQQQQPYRRPQQQLQQAPLPQTIIRVVPKDPGRSSPVSESTSFSQSTQQYGSDYYDSRNSRLTTEESESVVTDSTLLGSNADMKRQHTRQQNNNMRTFKEADTKAAIGSMNDESSDNTNWERVPVNQSSNLYWEHTDSTQGIYEARRETRQKLQQKKPPPAQRQTSNYADSSDSLSWKSSLDEDIDDDDDETTVVSQQVVPSNQGGSVARLRQNLETDLRFHKSMGDLQNHPKPQRRLERILSEGQSLSSVMPSYTPEESRDSAKPPHGNSKNQQFSNTTMVRSGSVEFIELQRNPDTQYSMKRAQSEKGLESDDDLLNQRKVTIGNETVIPDKIRTGSSGSADNRIICYNSEGKQPLKLVGGNVTGMFVHEIEKKSKASKEGLKVGDRILKLNNRSIGNLTREDVYAILKGIKSSVRMVVRNEMDDYQKVLSNGGSGDSFFIKTHFAYDASSKSEFSFKIGDVFSVRDTAPSGKQGLWRVAKMAITSTREQTGFIPNKFRADQIATSYKIAQLRAEEIRNKGGFIRKSFKRAKSLDRGMNRIDGDDFKEALKNVKSYEWVTQKSPGFRRPVVLLGLFCDSVRDTLLQDQPDRFGIPKGAIELSSNAPNGDGSVPSINTRPIEVVMQQGKHCLLIVSPSSIKYLQEHTQLNPIVIYLCPANKAIVKALKERFAPGFERKAGFMYDEAIQFSKRHHGLFSATVSYTNNGEWSKTLKETIVRLQEQPIWVSLERNTDGSSSDEEDSAEDDDEVSFPIQPQPFKLALDKQDDSSTRRGRARKPNRVSKTTDDLPDVPDEIRDVLNRHIGASVQQSSRVRNMSVDDVLSRGMGSTNYQDLRVEEESTVSNQSQLDTSHSSNSGGAKPKRSILKNKSLSSAEDSSGGDTASLATTTSASSVRQRGRQPSNPRNPPRAITIERADPAMNPALHQQLHAQQMAARRQYVIQMPQSLSYHEIKSTTEDGKSRPSTMQNSRRPPMERTFPNDHELLYHLMAEELIVVNPLPSGNVRGSTCCLSDLESRTDLFCVD